MLRQIRSGNFGDPAFVHSYRFELLGDALVERVIWKRLAEARALSGMVVADSGAVWYRFWLPKHDQVVERYYRADGEPLGMRIAVCGALTCDDEGCEADDFILDIWIDPQGRVTVRNEEEFERSVLLGELGPEAARQAEARLRELTAAIARGRFPPPLVRNWQIDLSRIAAMTDESAFGWPRDRAEDTDEGQEQETER